MFRDAHDVTVRLGTENGHLAQVDVADVPRHALEVALLVAEPAVGLEANGTHVDEKVLPARGGRVGGIGGETAVETEIDAQTQHPSAGTKLDVDGSLGKETSGMRGTRKNDRSCMWLIRLTCW